MRLKKTSISAPYQDFDFDVQTRQNSIYTKAPMDTRHDAEQAALAFWTLTSLWLIRNEVVAFFTSRGYFEFMQENFTVF